mmetsp:Transcript_76585/g.135099  ORF Transcript_76585/g.135099 Transcript_76585/m.135099 type:complete len:229 (+) Transcript_76585:238-924(+)
MVHNNIGYSNCLTVELCKAPQGPPSPPAGWYKLSDTKVFDASRLTFTYKTANVGGATDDSKYGDGEAWTSSDGLTLYFALHKANTNSLYGNVIAQAAADIDFGFPISKVRGSFVARPGPRDPNQPKSKWAAGSGWGQNADPDNCQGGQAMTSWFPTNMRAHDGYVMFGTPDKIIYGGCDKGPNYAQYTSQISETTVSGQKLRIAGGQSADHEAFIYDIKNIEVYVPGR